MYRKTVVKNKNITRDLNPFLPNYSSSGISQRITPHHYTLTISGLGTAFCMAREHCTVGLPTGSTGILLLPKISVSAVEEAAKSLSIRPLLALIIASFPHTNVEEQLSTQITPSSASWPRAMNAFIAIFCYSSQSHILFKFHFDDEVIKNLFPGGINKFDLVRMAAMASIELGQNRFAIERFTDWSNNPLTSKLNATRSQISSFHGNPLLDLPLAMQNAVPSPEIVRQKRGAMHRTIPGSIRTLRHRSSDRLSSEDASAEDAGGCKGIVDFPSPCSVTTITSSPHTYVEEQPSVQITQRFGKLQP
ncbi:hypothetical protein Aperf_G00000047948 [Anoplocephala perfoliata]